MENCFKLDDDFVNISSRAVEILEKERNLKNYLGILMGLNSEKGD